MKLDYRFSLRFIIYINTRLKYTLIESLNGKKENPEESSKT